MEQLNIHNNCLGLQHIHELNIVHLDIKPYNILFSDKVRQYVTYLNFLSLIFTIIDLNAP